MIQLYCQWFRGFVREGVHLFAFKKRVSTWLDILKVRSAEYGRLKTWIHYMKTLCIYQSLAFGGQRLKKKSWDHFITENYFEKPSESFEWVHVNKPDWPLQQYGENALTANTATAFLHDFFGYRIAGLRLWPPRSPDLTPSDVFLRGFLNQRVCSNNPNSLEVLKHNTERPVTDSDQQAMLQAPRHSVKRVKVFLQESGGRFQHLLELHISICL